MESQHEIAFIHFNVSLVSGIDYRRALLRILFLLSWVAIGGGIFFFRSYSESFPVYCHGAWIVMQCFFGSCRNHSYNFIFCVQKLDPGNSIGSIGLFRRQSVAIFPHRYSALINFIFCFFWNPTWIRYLSVGFFIFFQSFACLSGNRYYIMGRDNIDLSGYRSSLCCFRIISVPM